MELKNKGIVQFKTSSKSRIVEIANDIGSIFRVTSMPLVQTLTPRLKENEPNSTYSGNFGIGEFPFHTDLAHWYKPPRYLLLRCVIPATEVATKVIDSKRVLDKVEKYEISRANFLPRRRLDNKLYFLKLYSQGVFRWDSIFIVPSNKEAIILKEKVKEVIEEIEYEPIFLNEPGDCILIDNWRMLHGRSKVSQSSMNRTIERIYMNEILL